MCPDTGLPFCSLVQTWQSTILVVSHDRNFLNAVATDIIHLHSQRLNAYRGDFENFMKIKEERLKNQQREYEAQQQYREHIQVQGRHPGASREQGEVYAHYGRNMAPCHSGIPSGGAEGLIHVRHCFGGWVAVEGAP